VVEKLARECKLSKAHFSRAFSRSVGMAPHRWLMKRRIEVAKETLRDGRLSMSDVAAACGFCDQSHLPRFFHTDGWRKSARVASSAQGIANESSRRIRKLYPAARQNVRTAEVGFGSRRLSRHSVAFHLMSALPRKRPDCSRTRNDAKGQIRKYDDQQIATGML
jgi:AraC-like DNA-binding protein